MTSLDGKVILVTGATDGLGRALSADLARSGATVLVHGRDPGRIADTIAELGGRTVRAYQKVICTTACISFTSCTRTICAPFMIEIATAAAVA